MNKTELIVNNGLVRIVGVFETSNKPKQTASRFMQSGFEVENIQDPFALNFHKNYWYPDFRDIYFLKKEDTSATIYTKDIDEKVDFVVRTNRETGVQTLLNVCINSAEIFMFKGHLNFFSIDLSIEEKNLSSYSDLTFIVRNFESAIKSEGTDLKWVNWIEKNILCGIKISSDPSVKKVKVDDYSGSKFKLFSVLDLADAIDSSVRSELLYDIGCSAPIGSAGGNTAFTPSEPYFEELMENKISVFNNYDILPLFDSFTVIGDQLLAPDRKHFKNITWNQTYFRIFLHNLFIKFNLFRYNSEMVNDSVAVRDEFESFLNTYNLSHISYNFLPNLIYQKHRASLDIDAELEKFQDRINRISQAILEEKQNRSNMLLGLVGLVTSISSIEPVVSFINEFQRTSGISFGIYYTLVVVLCIALGIPLLMFLFPDKTKQLKRKWRERKN